MQYSNWEYLTVGYAEQLLTNTPIEAAMLKTVRLDWKLYLIVVIAVFLIYFLCVYLNLL